MEEYQQIKDMSSELNDTILFNISNFVENTKYLREIENMLPSRFN
jgi:hypothetical protein